jgi:hypothetical protein
MEEELKTEEPKRIKEPQKPKSIQKEDIVSGVINRIKDACLKLGIPSASRIVVFYTCHPEIQRVVSSNSEMIRNELGIDQLIPESILNEKMFAFTINGMSLNVSVRKVK